MKELKGVRMKSKLGVSVKGVQSIQEAEILLDGITVIAGENGCGKSTISEIIFMLLYAWCEGKSIDDSLFEGDYTLLNTEQIVDSVSSVAIISDILLSDDALKSGMWCDENCTPSTGDSCTEILKMIEDTMRGVVTCVKGLLVYVREDGLHIALLDCSQGIKLFGIMYALLKYGGINEKTFLIVDGVDGYLHPTWLVEYARILVFIRKNLGTRIVISSHYPGMVSAIKYISEKEGVQGGLNFYLAEADAENAYRYTYAPQGNDIENIFGSFNRAFELLDGYGEYGE